MPKNSVDPNKQNLRILGEHGKLTSFRWIGIFAITALLILSRERKSNHYSVKNETSGENASAILLKPEDGGFISSKLPPVKLYPGEAYYGDCDGIYFSDAKHNLQCLKLVNHQSVRFISAEKIVCSSKGLVIPSGSAISLISLRKINPDNMQDRNWGTREKAQAELIAPASNLESWINYRKDTFSSMANLGRITSFGGLLICSGMYLYALITEGFTIKNLRKKRRDSRYQKN